MHYDNLLKYFPKHWLKRNRFIWKNAGKEEERGRIKSAVIRTNLESKLFLNEYNVGQSFVLFFFTWKKVHK